MAMSEIPCIQLGNFESSSCLHKPKATVQGLWFPPTVNYTKADSEKAGSPRVEHSYFSRQASAIGRALS